MVNIEKIKIKYISPAYPPFKIDINKIYLLENDGKYFIINDDNKKEYCDLELIKMLFNPIEEKWEDVLVKEDTKKKEQTVKDEEVKN